MDSHGSTAPGEGAPMYLTVVGQHGGIAASLTDLKLLAMVESKSVADDELASFKHRIQQHPDGAATGRWLLTDFFPERIAQFLRDLPVGPLNLQLDPALSWIPWELLGSGDGVLGEKFQVCRRLATDAAPGQAAFRRLRRGTLKVLVVGGSGASEAGTERLNAALRSMSGITVSLVQAGHLPRGELLRLISSNDVVHYVGAVDGRPAPAGSVLWWREPEPLDISAVAALDSPPLLLVSEDTRSHDNAGNGGNARLAVGACKFGLNLLTCGTGPTSPADRFMRHLYAALAKGAGAAEAVRSSRSALRGQLGDAAVALLRAELHGDGGVLLVEGRGSVEDNRRQVTILSMDLAGSTRLMGTLGAEKYSDLLVQYHRLCDEILRSHGGSPDDFQGDDGAMCYFGTPVAREDAAAQALQASCELVTAIQALGLGMRVGVCTGQVVIRDGQPVGPAIHLAARLQSIAVPGTVVVGDSTRRIVKDRFRFETLEEGILLKGFDGPQVCHRLLGPALHFPPDPAAGTGSPRVTPLVGRRDELHALQEHWAAAQEPSLRIVRLLGDAGIGKSRLVREFKKMLVDTGHEVFETHCSPEHANSAFHPLIQALRNELGVNAGYSPESLLLRLGALVSVAGELEDASMVLLADLLSLPLPAPHAMPEQSAERRRQLTVDLLVSLAMQRVRGKPACMIVEDIHWLDPSTAELLDRLAVSLRDMPLLLLVTARSDTELRWRPRFAVYETELRGLSPEQSRAMVLSACGARRLPSELVQSIAARADGVPLFIEESTRMALDIAGQDAPDLAAMPVPSTVLDLLTARLDRLGRGKQVAQVGGTIGRGFPVALLQAVLQHPDSPINAPDLGMQLAELVRAGMLVAKASDDGPRYVFRHQLMRDAAYGSLLERDRLRLHQIIAGVVSERFRGLADSQPELLAFHYTEAGMEEEALRHWEAAARNAAARSAHAEAISHVGNALAVLARMPRSERLLQLELRLQLLLAGRLIATRGYGADRVERAYARAMELAKLLGDEGSVMRVLLGLEGYHFMRANFEEARAHALEAKARAEQSGAAIHRVQTQWALANIRMHQGDMGRAVQEMDACRAAYMRLEHRPEAVQDPGVMCLCYSAWSLWQLGFPDEARRRVIEVVEHAERIQHQFSLGEAYGFRAAVLHFRGENREAMASAERAVQICEENGFTVWLAHARVMRGRIAAELGDVAAGVEEMRQGYASWSASGAVVTTPFYLAMRAEGHALDGRPEDGLALLEQALAIVSRTGERYYEAEVRRLIGRLTLASAVRAGLDRDAEAEGWLREALECARSRELRSLALRAAIDLADLWRPQGRDGEAQRTLAAACQAIEGGEGTRDLAAARERLRVPAAPH